MRLRPGHLVEACLALWLVACGGKVVVDQLAASSSSAAGGGATTGTTSSTGPAGTAVTATGVTTGGGADLCGQACSAIAGCLFDPSDCIASCQQANPNCAPSFVPFLSCIVGSVNPKTCDLPPDCQK